VERVKQYPGLTPGEGEMPDPSTDEIEALYRAGLRFEADGALEVADQNYRQALELLKPDDKENFNALHYRLGRVAEALGRNEEAEEYYSQVAASDQS
jgi:tetratricopeptide (TPR) repeat protein